MTLTCWLYPASAHSDYRLEIGSGEDASISPENIRRDIDKIPGRPASWYLNAGNAATLLLQVVARELPRKPFKSPPNKNALTTHFKRFEALELESPDETPSEPEGTR